MGGSWDRWGTLGQVGGPGTGVGAGTGQGVLGQVAPHYTVSSVLFPLPIVILTFLGLSFLILAPPPLLVFVFLLRSDSLPY